MVFIANYIWCLCLFFHNLPIHALSFAPLAVTGISSIITVGFSSFFHSGHGGVTKFPQGVMI